MVHWSNLEYYSVSDKKQKDIDCEQKKVLVGKKGAILDRNFITFTHCSELYIYVKSHM